MLVEQIGREAGQKPGWYLTNRTGACDSRLSSTTALREAIISGGSRHASMRSGWRWESRLDPTSTSEHEHGWGADLVSVSGRHAGISQNGILAVAAS